MKPADGSSAARIASSAAASAGAAPPRPVRALIGRALRVLAALAEITMVGLCAGVVAAALVALARTAHVVAPTATQAAIVVSVLAAGAACLLSVWRARAAFGAGWVAALGLRRTGTGWAGRRLAAVALFGLGAQVAWIMALSRATGIPIRLQPPGGAILPVFAAWLVVLGPFSEELLFRGLCDARLRRVAPGWFAFAATAGLFVASHADGGWARPLSVLPLALMLGGLRRATGSLWPGLGLHVLNNGLVLAHSLRP